MPSDDTIVLRGATAIVHDGTTHRILHDADVAYAGDRIVHVGPRGTFERSALQSAHSPATIEPVRGKLLLPGFVSARTNLVGNALPRSRTPIGIDDADAQAAIRTMRWALSRLVHSGVTTAVAIGVPDSLSRSLTALANDAGIRLYHTAAAAGDDPQHRLAYARIDNADIASIEQLAARARSHAGPLLIDFADNAFAFHHALRTHGVTPVAMLAQHGLLHTRTSIAGFRIIAGDTASAYPYDTDVPLLVAAGASLAVTPCADARNGTWSAGAARVSAARGNIAIGVDAPPFDMFEELRAWTLSTKAMSGDHEAGTARDAFCAATTGGASALGRADLGRLAAGARADIVVLALDRLRIGPVFDPVRALVACADAEMVERVIIGGRVVVDEGACVG